MATSFVSINDHNGFWMLDSVLELWLKLLALHIEESPEENFIGRKIRDQWLLASRGFFLGHIPVNLEEAISTDEGRDVVIRAINSLLDALAKAPEKLDRGTLNLLSTGVWGTDFETWRLIEVGNAFLDLMAGKIESDARSTAFMPDCREKQGH